MVDFKFYLITDRILCQNQNRSLSVTLEQACQSGVKAVQLREKDLSPIQLYTLAKEVKSILDSHNCRLLINDRADIACSIEASGVHLTEKSLPAYEVRKCFGSTRPLIGVSTHSIDSLLRAQAAGADFALFGPIFYTEPKASYGEPLGIKALETAAKKAEFPVFAIGGITPEKAKTCLEAGAYGISAISAIMSAKNVFQAVKEFEEALGDL